MVERMGYILQDIQTKDDHEPRHDKEERKSARDRDQDLHHEPPLIAELEPIR